MIYVAARMKKSDEPDGAEYIEPRTTPLFTLPTEEPGSGFGTDDPIVLGSLFDDVMFWLKNRYKLTSPKINKKKA